MPFGEKLNCTPKQWIRQQRLKAAKEQLQSAQRSLSHFCTDFRRGFGVRTSQLYRRSL
jgi:AraC-like DNA-binding protein